MISYLRFFLVLNNIVKSVLKGSEALLFVDDFALCICTKSLPHRRNLYNCVNSVQDWVSNNRLKISLAKQSMHFVINVKRQAEPSNLLDKNPIKLVTEAKFLGVTFDHILSFNNYFRYLKI